MSSRAPAHDIPSILASVPRPSRMLVTAGMPYANGPLHLGHLAGAHLPADIFARWARMLIGAENVLYVCGGDEHGSTSEVAALQAGVTIREFVDRIHDGQAATLARYSISLDVFSGTSRPECLERQKVLVHDFLVRLERNGMLEKRTSRQWYDPVAARFLPDRLVRGTCPNTSCGDTNAYSDECDRCGHQHDPSLLIDPRSAVSDGVPELRDTVHWWLNMGAVAPTLRAWIESKSKTWRRTVLADVLERVKPSLRFDAEHEPLYKEHKSGLPGHKAKYAPGKKVLLQFDDEDGLAAGREQLRALGIDGELADEWAWRPITRDIAWGVPITEDPELVGKTLYVWPDSLIAPIAFTQLALTAQGRDPAEHTAFWSDPDARVVQFLGQDNVFFYVLMQGALWLGSQDDPHRMPVAGEWQLTDVIGCCHLLVAGEKMSKSRGTFLTGDQLLDEMGYTADQIRYYLALLGLAESPSDFDRVKLDQRNAFLAGPLNAAFEKPISATHSKYGGRVPEGELTEKVVKDTTRIVQRYVKCMQRADYPNLLFEIENYARTINSLFAQHKPHDDRYPEEARRNALYTSFYVLKTLMILLHPFVPDTTDRLRRSLRLPETVFRVEELGTPIPAGHEIGGMLPFFPDVADSNP